MRADKQCAGKIRFLLRGHAEKALVRVLARDRARHGAEEATHVYECPECLGFHIGHMPSEQRVAFLEAEGERKRIRRARTSAAIEGSCERTGHWWGGLGVHCLVCGSARPATLPDDRPQGSDSTEARSGSPDGGDRNPDRIAEGVSEGCP